MSVQSDDLQEWYGKPPLFPGYLVICGNDTTAEEHERTVMATYRVFKTWEAASRYAATVCPSRNPTVVRIEKGLRG
jgi:hypothetical protein